MTFSLDRTRSFLKIDEPHLLSLHRSIHPIVPSADYCQGHLCDAFICVAHEYNMQRVYVALHDQQLKSNLVFTADPIKPDDKKLAALVQEACGFLQDIGFEMKQVDINFSSAMREVIIKDVRAMREPSPAVQLDAAKIALEGMIAEKNEIALRAHREQTALKAELDELRGRLGAAMDVQQAAVVELPDNAGKRSGPAVHDGDEEEGLRLVRAQQELLKEREELGTVKAALKSAMESLKGAKDEARQARKEQKLHKHASDELRGALKSAQVELDTVRKELEAVRSELREAGKKHESALHKRVANHDAAEAAHHAETADLKAEINRLTAELARNDAASTGEVEVLKAALAEATVSLAAERAKNESALQEMDALEHNASDELKLLKKRVDTLAAEKQLLEKIATEFKIKANGEIERQQQINQAQRAAAIKKLQALQEEIRLLTEARAVIASPTGMSLVPSGEHVPSLPADKREVSFASQPGGFSFDPFGSYEAIEYINFLPDPSLKGIPYSCSTDVVEVYRSYNTINAAPTGKRAQKCDGFVCLVTEGGQSRVYVAWQMRSTGETLICLPERVPEGDDSCLKILHEGIGYFERIGFVIDKLRLEADPDKRQIQLDGLPVFCRTITECAA